MRHRRAFKAGGDIAWVLPSLEVQPLQSRPATAASLAELTTRYVSLEHDPLDPLTEAAGVVAFVLTQLAQYES